MHSLRFSTFHLLALGLFCAATAPAQNNPLLPDTTTRVSDHVYAILGWPNVAIVIGSRATLVVDTGFIELETLGESQVPLVEVN